MRKNILFTAMFLLFLPLLLTTTAVSANPSAQLEQADSLFKKGQYEQAEAIYQQVIAEYAGTDDAFAAQKQLTFLYIAWNRYPQAETAYNQLLANFSGNKDISQAVHDIAYRYRCVNKREKANELDQYVVDTWPDSDYALLGQMDIAKYYVDQGDEPNAEAATAKLLTNYSGHALIARAVHDVAQHYRYTQRYKKANELYQFVVETWPKAEHALWAQADLIKSYLALGDDSSAEAAVEKLIADFSWSEHIARAIHDTAWEYRKLANYGWANELDQYVIDHWPKDVQAMWAKMDMAKTDIVLGNYATADKTVDILIADFSDQPELSTAIFMLGEQYYNKAFACENQGQTAEAKSHFQKAIAIWERIINELPQSSITPQAYYFAARCYDKLDQKAKALEYYQVVVDTWPDYEFSWHSQLSIARRFLELGKRQEIPMAEAVYNMREACRKVLSNYPDLGGDAAERMLRRWKAFKIEKGKKQ